jgi:hypothetical protein
VQRRVALNSLFTAVFLIAIGPACLAGLSLPLTALSDLVLMRSNSLLSPAAPLGKSQTQYHTISFKTGAAGAIKSIEIQYQGGGARPTIEHSRLIEALGIGPGKYQFQFGTQAVYTVDAVQPPNIAAGTDIRIMIGDVYARTEGCYGLFLRTRDNNDAEIESGSIAITTVCNNKLGAVELPDDAVTGQLGLSELAFGRCPIDPPRINDNSDLYLHMNGLAATGTPNNPDGSKNGVTSCKLGVSRESYVIAFPPADLDTRLVPKGATVHCPTSCHLDVKIRNTAPPDGGIDGGLRVWSWIAFKCSNPLCVEAKE